MDRNQCKFIGILMAVNCVRNTVVETYHTEGKLTDDDMKAFNREVTSKLYTFLSLYFGKTEAQSKIAFLDLMAHNYPTGWELPKLDRGFVKDTKRLVRRRSKGKSTEAW